MARSAVHAVWIAVGKGVPERVRAAADEHKSRRVKLSAQPRWSTRRLPREQAAEVRAAWREEVRRLRTEGLLLDTHDALIEFGVREEMRVRGWDRQWDEAPEEAWDQGRWPGSRDSGHPGRLAARLDAVLVGQVVAACWHTSSPAIRAIRVWRDNHPGITPPRHHQDGTRKDVGPLAEYEHLARQITTTGTIWRAGITHGLAQAADTGL
ncbi:hypothetical protein [Streptomyces sp. NPDC020965]|uniref:hypothetical protein n=1 Tax=Streptomyces sp. NPDC020965 TaxID=3365105 RepID=UPI003793A30A